MTPYDQLGVYKRRRGLMQAEAARVRLSLGRHARSMGGGALRKTGGQLCRGFTTFATRKVTMRALCPDKGANC